MPGTEDHRHQVKEFWAAPIELFRQKNPVQVTNLCPGEARCRRSRGSAAKRSRLGRSFLCLNARWRDSWLRGGTPPKRTTKTCPRACHDRILAVFDDRLHS